MPARARLSLAAALAGCSTVGGQDPSEEGMVSDDVQVEVDGVLVQCGNADEVNHFWQASPEGPYTVRVMPVVCMGPQATSDFDLDDAELIDGVYQFPTWAEEISARCTAACLAAHDPDIDEDPVCLESAFVVNPAWGDWAPEDGPNCDSTIFAEDSGP